MGLFIKILLLLVVLALALPFILKDQEGQPLMTLDELKTGDMDISGAIERIPDATELLPAELGGDDSPDQAQPSPASPGGKTRIYSWRDEEGNMHFTNEPPPDKKQAKVIVVNPNINVMPAPKLPEAEASPQVAAPTSNDDEPASIYTPQQVDRLLEEARAVEGKLQQRNEEHNQIMDQR